MAASGVLDNTREAFAQALAAGAGFIESDCHLSSDGRVVLFHDHELTRLFGDTRKVNRVTYAELAALMKDRGGLLALDDALAAFPDAHFNIDMKSADVAVPAGEIIGRLAPHRVLIASFSEQNRLMALEAAVAAGKPEVARPVTSASQAGIIRLVRGLVLRSRDMVARALDGVDALQIPEKFGPVRVLTPRLIEAAHAHGVEVHVWTVNDPHTMQRLVALGVDGIVTDRTEFAVQALR